MANRKNGLTAIQIVGPFGSISGFQPRTERSCITWSPEARRAPGQPRPRTTKTRTLTWSPDSHSSRSRPRSAALRAIKTHGLTWMRPGPGLLQIEVGFSLGTDPTAIDYPVVGSRRDSPSGRLSATQTSHPIGRPPTRPVQRTGPHWGNRGEGRLTLSRS